MNNGGLNLRTQQTLEWKELVLRESGTFQVMRHKHSRINDYPPNKSIQANQVEARQLLDEEYEASKTKSQMS
jgi:hypothetical protein